VRQHLFADDSVLLWGKELLIHARNLEGLTRTVWTVQLSPDKCNLCLREITFNGRTYPGPWPSQINDPWEKLLADFDNRSASSQGD